MSIFKKIAFLLLGLGALIVPMTVFADNYGLDTTAGASGIKDKYPNDVPTLVGNVIGTALSMIAVIFFILMVYGGFLWMTAHGDSGQIDKAKDTIIAAIIGIIVVLASYAITNFVFAATKGNGGGGPASGGGASSDTCTAKYGEGFSCRNIGECDAQTTHQGVCPGGDTIVCCKQFSCSADAECQEGIEKCIDNHCVKQ